MKLRSAFLSGLAVIICVVAGLVPAAAETAAQSPQSSAHPAHPNNHPWVLPYGAARSASAPAGAHLTYYGGRVISNVQVDQVIYGSGSYLAQTTSTGSPSVKSFYTGVTRSPYFDWLNEYNTAGLPAPTSGQTIGRGTYGGLYTIVPSVANNTATIQDSNVQAELAAQINAGKLPPPTADGAGNRNTLYAVYFRHGQSICSGGSCSLVTGGFCAYHGTFVLNGVDIYYAVEPDLTGVTGCGASTDFNNTTSVASHELVEAVTDAEVGLATSNAPPLGWYDNVNGEIGDICNGQQGSVVGGDGVTYTVQTEFSNQLSNCIVQKASVANDFSISVTPASASVAPGGSAAYHVSTAVTSGSAQPVSLAVSGLPSGVTASFSPVSVTAGGSSTLTVTASPSAAPATKTVTVTGTASSGSHTTTASLTVTGSSTGIVNGGFETGSFSPWTTSGASETVVSGGAHAGTYADRNGSTTATNGDSSTAQTFTAPSGATKLSFWYKMTCPDTVTYDWATVVLRDNTVATTATALPKVCTTNAWTQVTVSIVAGHSYTLTLTSHDDNYAGDPTYTLFDDVTVSSPAPVTGIVNGGFETGSFSPWTTSGASETVVSGGAHSGTYADRNGSTTATNGDSSTAQTFTAPSGATKLSFWYKMTCPDTVTYDWATVVLRDNTVATTATALPKVCTTNAWTQVTVSIVAGHSYTLTLTSHDDNYAGDPTYTLFDDVTTT